MQLSNLPQTKELIDQAKSVFVIVGSRANQDLLAAASALYSGLQIADKEVKLLSVTEPRQKFGIDKLDELKSEVGHQNLLVSFEYNEEAVDKVSYHIGEETNKFYLTIKPKKGHEPLKSDTVEFSYTGADADLIILIGVGSLEELEQLYIGYEKLYQDSAVITLNEYQTGFGSVKYDLDDVTGYSELTATLMSELELVIDQDSATHLLSGIERKSKGFRSPKTTADTFDAVAKLLRLGAVRTDEKPLENDEPVSRDNSKNKSGEVSLNLGGGQPKRRRHDHSQDQRKNQGQKQDQAQKRKNQPTLGGLNYQPAAGEGGANS